MNSTGDFPRVADRLGTGSGGERWVGTRHCLLGSLLLQPTRVLASASTSPSSPSQGEETQAKAWPSEEDDRDTPIWISPDSPRHPLSSERVNTQCLYLSALAPTVFPGGGLAPPFPRTHLRSVPPTPSLDLEHPILIYSLCPFLSPTGAF